MQFGNRVFRPRIIPTIITLSILPVLLNLGFWQLDRAEEKREILKLFKQQNAAGPLLVTDKTKINKNTNYRDSRVEGQYVADKLIFIDNKIHHGKSGVYVLTPYKLKNSDYSILVNRGWVAMAADRSSLPRVSTDKNVSSLLGKIKILTEKPFTIGEQFQSNKGWPALMQWINIAEIEKKSGLKLLPYIFLLDKNEQTGFVRDWKPVILLPEKSTSYAVQWFSLALALLVIYIVVNLKKIKRETQDGE